MRRMYQYNVTVAANSSLQQYFAHLHPTAFGSRTSSVNAASPTLATVAGVADFPVQAYCRLIGGETAITCLSRADDIGGEVYYWNSANAKTNFLTLAASADEYFGDVSPVPAEIEADRILCPHNYRNDGRTHRFSAVPDSLWGPADVTQNWNVNAVAGQHFGPTSSQGFLLDISNTTAVAQVFKVDVCVIVEYYAQAHEHFSVPVAHSPAGENALNHIKAKSSSKGWGHLTDSVGSAAHKIGKLFGDLTTAVEGGKKLAGAFKGPGTTYASYITEAEEMAMAVI
jgi:hypothetical protein